MAPVGELHRLVWGGKLFTTESWSCSLHVNSTPGLNIAASNFQAAFVAWMGRASSTLNPAASLDFVKFNTINPVTGRYTLPFSNELVSPNLAVGAGSVSHGQLALCISTSTAVARGRGHAGRFYSPAGAFGTDVATGLINATAAGAALTSALSLCRDINTIVGAGSSLVVFSKRAQTVTTITGLRVGRVMDTMRSRRRSLDESYVSGAL